MQIQEWQEMVVASRVNSSFSAGALALHPPSHPLIKDI